MNVRSFKTALIVLLCVGVVLQTGRLWFEESSGHNFFSSVLNVRQKPLAEQHKIEPESVMVSTRNMRYLKAGNEDDIKVISDGLITRLAADGRYVGAETENWERLLESKSVIYTYPVTISAESFARSYGETGGEFVSRVSGLNAIVIKPARTPSEHMRIYVVDSLSGVSHIFETGRGVSEPLSKEMDRLSQFDQSQEESLFYISSEQNGLDFFTGNVYLPQWQARQYSYLKPYVSNPIEEAPDFESCVLPFFDNPVGVLSAVDPAGAPFASGRESVVKYYGGDEVIEYTSYLQINNPRTTLNQAYTAAVAFMERDPTLANDLVMTDARLNDGIWTIWYDYTWGGARVFTNEGHGIEVVVAGDTVVKYRRTVKRISTSDSYGQLEETFLAALDYLYESGAGDKIDGLELMYDASENGTRDLMWFTINRGVTKSVH